METKKPKDPNSALIETLRSSELTSMIVDVAELGLDAALAAGLVEDLPVVSWIVGVSKTVSNVRNYFLVQKLMKFLEGLDEITPEEKTELLNKLEEDSKFQKRVGEMLLIVLDRLDHVDKANYLSKLFSAYGRSEITYDEFLRLSASIEHAYIADLTDLLNYFEEEKARDRPSTKRKLYTSDFSDFYVLTTEEQKRAGLEHPQIYHFNAQAQKFAKAVLKERFNGGRW
ncbi:MAG: hypothetical protein MN733_35305 [Nitrososphaera sp.]|nr:hypothetical protein [Nitrososphaera sp.]